MNEGTKTVLHRRNYLIGLLRDMCLLRREFAGAQHQLRSLVVGASNWSGDGRLLDDVPLIDLGRELPITV